MRRCVWSRNLKNEEAMVHVGPQRHGGGDVLYIERCHILKPVPDDGLQISWNMLHIRQ